MGGDINATGASSNNADFDVMGKIVSNNISKQHWFFVVLYFFAWNTFFVLKSFCMVQFKLVVIFYITTKQETDIKSAYNLINYRLKVI